MALNLLETAKGYSTDAVVTRVSSSLNEAPERVQQALAGAFPLFLNALYAQSKAPDGLGRLTSLINQFMADSAVSSPAEATAHEAPDTLIGKGAGLIDGVFGAKAGSVSAALAQYAGLKQDAGVSLLQLAASVIIGLLGRQLSGLPGGVNGDNLQHVLSADQEAVASAIPAGLSALLSGGAKAGGAGATGNVPTSTPAYSDSLTDRSTGFRGWPWVLAAVVVGGLLFLFYLFSDAEAPTSTINTTTDDTTSASVQDATATTDSAASGTASLVDSASNALLAADSSAKALAAALGTFGPKKLPDGIELTIPANGVETKLIAFIDDSSKVVNKETWFNFDRLVYETGSASLKPESREQLQNMAAILKAYPAVALKIGGYTDNTGNAADNKKLSQSRAESVVAELVRLGVNQTRLEAEGYGQQHPVASNKTEAGRAQNRRTAVRVIKK